MYLRKREFAADWRQDYASTYAGYRFEVPERYNLAADTCLRHADNPARQNLPALIHETDAGEVRTYSYRQLQRSAARFANVLQANGSVAGDRIAVLLPQRPETAVVHLASAMSGMLAVPMTVLFRREALQYRLSNSEASAIVVEEQNLWLIEPLLPELPALRTVYVLDAQGNPLPEAHLDFTRQCERAADRFTPRDTLAETPALLVYTSGTTGNPKGAVLPHRSLIGHFPGIELSMNLLPQRGDVLWSPADWAWVGGLTNILLSGMHFGVPVFCFTHRGSFQPEKALHMMAKHRVTTTLMPSTALRMIGDVSRIGERFALQLRALASGGEAVGKSTIAWAREALGLQINEAYGQTEANYFIGNCNAIWPSKDGALGRAFPGHRVAIVDAEGNPLAPDEEGDIALDRQDPVVMKEYWKNPQATAEKFRGTWLITGDRGSMDADGFLWFKGRADDVILSAGHRVGPVEVEDVLLKHPAVALAAVVPKPDAMRNHIIKAYVRVAQGYVASEETAREIQAFVKDRLAVHEYPREIEFIADFPLTTTGKVIRAALRDRAAE